MSPLARAIRGVIWLAAAGIMVVAILLGLAAILQARKSGVFPLSVILWALLFLAGAALFFKGTAISRRISDDDDDDDGELNAEDIKEEGKE